MMVKIFNQTLLPEGVCTPSDRRPQSNHFPLLPNCTSVHTPICRQLAEPRKQLTARDAWRASHPNHGVQTQVVDSRSTTQFGKRMNQPRPTLCRQTSHGRSQCKSRSHQLDSQTIVKFRGLTQSKKM